MNEANGYVVSWASAVNGENCTRSQEAFCVTVESLQTKRAQTQPGTWRGAMAKYVLRRRELNGPLHNIAKLQSIRTTEHADRSV